MIFFSFLEERDFVVGPQGGQPLCPLVTHPTNSPNAGKSCTLHMHMARSINVSLEKTSNAWTLVHRTYNSSISGCRYTSTFSTFTNFFLGIIRANINKYRLVTSQGGKLWFNNIMGHVKWQEPRSPNGFTPLSTYPNLMLQASLATSRWCVSKQVSLPHCV